MTGFLIIYTIVIFIQLGIFLHALHEWNTISVYSSCNGYMAKRRTKQCLFTFKVLPIYLYDRWAIKPLKHFESFSHGRFINRHIYTNKSARCFSSPKSDRISFQLIRSVQWAIPSVNWLIENSNWFRENINPSFFSIVRFFELPTPNCRERTRISPSPSRCEH